MIAAAFFVAWSGRCETDHEKFAICHTCQYEKTPLSCESGDGCSCQGEFGFTEEEVDDVEVADTVT